jgi:hypothetical protein
VAHGGAPRGVRQGRRDLFDRRRCSQQPEMYGFRVIV